MRLPLAIIVVAAFSGLGAGAGCGALDLGTGSGGFGGGFTTGPTTGPGGLGDQTTGGGAAVQDTFNYSLHCGDMQPCVPGTALASECMLEEVGGAGGTGGGSTSGSGGAGGGSTSGSGGAGGGSTSGAGGTGGEGGVTSTPAGDCRLAISDTGETLGICVAPPDNMTPIVMGGSCLRTDQCDVGLGCVKTGDGENKQCRPYCCGDVEACPQDTYCALARAAEQDIPPTIVPENAPRVPVCVDADKCELGTPCNDPNEICTVVRLTEPVTSCIPKGDGHHGDACPCDAEHFCDTSINQCRKLCVVNQPDACPTGFSCYGGFASVPYDGWGICSETF